MTVATIDDVATSLGQPFPTAGSVEAAQWQMWLGDAELQIRLRLGDLSVLDQDALKFVEREAVVLKIKQPDPISTRQVSVDDGSESTTWNRASGLVAILPEWWAMLTRTDESAFAIDTAPTDQTGGHAYFCPYLTGSAYCTCGAILLDSTAYIQ